MARLHFGLALGGMSGFVDHRPIGRNSHPRRHATAAVPVEKLIDQLGSPDFKLGRRPARRSRHSAPMHCRR